MIPIMQDQILDLGVAKDAIPIMHARPNLGPGGRKDVIPIMQDQILDLGVAKDAIPIMHARPNLGPGGCK